MKQPLVLVTGWKNQGNSAAVQVPRILDADGVIVGIDEINAALTHANKLKKALIDIRDKIDYRPNFEWSTGIDEWLDSVEDIARAAIASADNTEHGR